MKLLYIVSHGHSGSTLLDMLLGLHDNVFSTGELIHLPNQYYRNKHHNPSPYNGLICSCGKGFYECTFWGEVILSLKNQLRFDIIKNPLKFKLAFFMKHSIPHRKLIHKIKRSLFFIIIRGKISFLDKFVLPSQKQIIKNNEILIKSIQKLSKKEFIVDSSKDLIRLHYLLKSDLEIKVIVLKRNILGVSASGKKQKSSSLKTAQSWIKYYKRLESVLAFNNLNPIIISYEDLVGDTKSTLNHIYEDLEQKRIDTFSGNFNTKDYHIVAGNGLRYRGIVSVNHDDKWKHLLDDNEKKQISQLIGK